MKIIVASSNKGKIKEIESILKNVEIIPYTDLINFIEIEENGKTFEENAILKAKTIYEKLPSELVLADDSGISVPILGNIPGIYSARFAGESATDKDNLNKLINELKKKNIKQTKAFYAASIALASPFGVFTTHGFMYGDVIDEIRGDKGFGYDPIFIPKGFGKTLGELDENVKQKLSHRTKAIELMRLLILTIK